VLLHVICALLKHTLRGLALTALAAGIAIGLDAGLRAVPSPLPWDNAYGRHPTFYDWLAVVLALLTLLWPFLTAGFLILYRRKTRASSIRSEAGKWLALQRTQSPGTLRQYAKMERRTLWGPTVFVLVTFLFFPEITGIISHAFHGRYASVGPYRVAVPLTWTIFHKDRSNLWVLYAKGIAREGLGPYCDDEELQSVGFKEIPPDERPNLDWRFKYATIVSSEDLRLGNRTLVCYDVLWHPHRAGEVTRPDPIWVNLDCRTKTRDFTASFSGQRADLRRFYHILETMQGP
jgi:hypothetical protein